jgi:undecaprenyl-diphosphatase
MTRFVPLLFPLLLLALWVAMMSLGTGAVDQALLAFLYSADRPGLRTAAQAITLAGEWPSMVAIVVLAALWLFYRRRLRAALLFLGVTLSGRLLILLQKEAVGRMRPDAQEHLIEVKSLSFPSAHTANSMIVFLALALLVAPKRYRRVAVMLALLGTLGVGLTRPMLGVHWPSDVIAGWSFGALWVLMFARAWRTRAPFHSVGVQAR